MFECPGLAERPTESVPSVGTWFRRAGPSNHWRRLFSRLLRQHQTALRLNEAGRVGASAPVWGTEGLIPRGEHRADSRKGGGGWRSLGFLPQHARMSCFSHRWIPDKRAFMNYKMKIDNPLSVSSACALRNTHSKTKPKSGAQKNTVICNASCSLVCTAS